jgi:hypothetical protein
MVELLLVQGSRRLKTRLTAKPWNLEENTPWCKEYMYSHTRTEPLEIALSSRYFWWCVIREELSGICSMLFASFWTKMLWGLVDSFPAQCTEVLLACPTEDVVVVSHLRTWLPASRAWMSKLPKHFSLHLCNILTLDPRIHLHVPSIKLFLREKLTWTPEMFITFNCTVTLVAEVLATITTWHLIASFYLMDSHLAPRAHFWVLHNCLDAA